MGLALQKIYWVGWERTPLRHLAPILHTQAWENRFRSLRAGKDRADPFGRLRVESSVNSRLVVVGSLAQAKPKLGHSADRWSILASHASIPFASAHRRDYWWMARQDENVGWMPNPGVTAVGQETVGPGPE
eukprot:4633104-Pleurochrysis_carterae.AAC.1